MTMEPLRHIKPSVRSIAAYTLAARPAAVKLNQNENPYDLPDAVKERVVQKALARPWARYPEFDPRELIEQLAAFAGWRPDGVLAGNGSNELIEALLLVTVGPGTRVVIPEPTFTLYALLTRVLGGETIRVGLGPELEYQPEELRRVRRELSAPLTVVCSPNNPTGGLLAADELARLCEEADGLVAVDEAYHEFSGQSAVPLLARHPNLVVLRTFSKAMALAGLRVGYLLASPEIVREVNKARLPYNLDFFSEAAALAALAEWPVLRANVEKIVGARDDLLHRLYRIPGVRPYPSKANFILLELAEADPRTVFESVYRRGVLVRDVTSYPRLQRCLRVTVGSEAENETFLSALRHALEERRFARA
ncbi:MAG: histidinol-phosphate transaminase [Acidobacteria bacterium]|nr:MAG: histidinol-phosphate transaminase [Acidobacteriota bacterium]PYQ25120.1 MAG: histidinol-phosphate transaminase [Acidobacteriota bacterium]